MIGTCQGDYPHVSQVGRDNFQEAIAWRNTLLLVASHNARSARASADTPIPGDATTNARAAAAGGTSALAVVSKRSLEADARSITSDI
jgi:hypothetical protein